MMTNLKFALFRFTQRIFGRGKVKDYLTLSIMFILVPAIFCACDAQKKDWEKALSENTIPAFEDFLNRYTEGPLVDKAHSRIEALYNERHPEFRDVKTIRIIINQSYDERNDAAVESVKKIMKMQGSELSNDNYYLNRSIRKILEYAGFKALEDDSENYDATLTIEVNGKKKGAYYISSISTFSVPIPGEGILTYSGASVSGMISLKIRNSYVYKKSFEGNKPPPSHLKAGMRSPFFDAFAASGSFVPGIVEMVQKIFGFNSLTNIAMQLYGFTEIGTDVASEAALRLGEIKDARAVEPLIVSLKKGNRYAARALGEIKDARAVKPLIAAIENENRDIRDISAEALGKIKDARAVEYLITAMTKGKNRFAVEALINIGKPAIKPLISVMGDKKESIWVREKAAYALSNIGWEPSSDSELAEYLLAGGEKESFKFLNRGVGHLIDALRDDYFIVRERAVEVLKRMGWEPSNDSELVTYLLAQQKWYEMIKIGSPAVKHLISHLQEIVLDIRKSKVPRPIGARGDYFQKVIKVLGEIKDKRAVEPLIDILRWKTNAPFICSIQIEAIKALGKIKDERAIESLKGCLVETPLREAAIEALKNIQNSKEK